MSQRFWITFDVTSSVVAIVAIICVTVLRYQARYGKSMRG